MYLFASIPSVISASRTNWRSYWLDISCWNNVRLRPDPTKIITARGNIKIELFYHIWSLFLKGSFESRQLSSHFVSVIFFKMHFHITNILCYPDCFSYPEITFFDFAFHPINRIGCCVTFFMLDEITTIFTRYRTLLFLRFTNLLYIAYAISLTTVLSG